MLSMCFFMLIKCRKALFFQSGISFNTVQETNALELFFSSSGAFWVTEKYEQNSPPQKNEKDLPG